MPDTNRAVVSRSIRIPGFDKRPRAQAETIAAVGVSNFEDFPGNTLSLCNQKYKARLLVVYDGNQCDGAVLHDISTDKPLPTFPSYTLRRHTLILSCAMLVCPGPSWPMRSSGRGPQVYSYLPFGRFYSRILLVENIHHVRLLPAGTTDRLPSAWAGGV